MEKNIVLAKPNCTSCISLNIVFSKFPFFKYFATPMVTIYIKWPFPYSIVWCIIQYLQYHIFWLFLRTIRFSSLMYFTLANIRCHRKNPPTCIEDVSQGGHPPRESWWGALLKCWTSWRSYLVTLFQTIISLCCTLEKSKTYPVPDQIINNWHRQKCGPSDWVHSFLIHLFEPAIMLFSVS